ncbi:MAG: DUF5686 and carboxypeptidase regulatory-like domain-containing protein [Chitinophagaceae bacterium]|jgi:hypothetical protein|nr:DUF5686 and carboxypeptidase regulatory-like domain-containing protein [Chitinophagaceae bacterium]
MKLLSVLLITFSPVFSLASVITGTVKDSRGNALPFSSILIKGVGKGTTANAKGEYSLTVNEGEYTLVCQSVGYKTVEQKVTVDKENQTINFVLQEQQYNLNDVVVKGGGEDPAYAIIRNAIKKRPEYVNELNSFECEVYLKGQLQLRDYPTKFLGQKVDFEDGDTSKKKMLYLTESLAKYSVEGSKKKIEVLSTKVSGNSAGYGFGSPQIISFYENNIQIGDGLNPRGFISPIADNALNFYKYKFSGTFFENGKEVSRIEVIPKRKYEPLFSGFINIIENEWRIQSVQLTLLKEQQMQLLDTLKIEQLYVPLNNTWVIKQQVVYLSGKFLSFDFFGNFVQVYDKFDLEPSFAKKFFSGAIIKYDTGSNKKSMAYWDSIRPVPLLVEEAIDYKKKDSLEQLKKDPRYLDSLDKKNNKIGALTLFAGRHTNSKNKSSTSWLLGEGYNTVEGIFLNYNISYVKRFDDSSRKMLMISPVVRYGFHNGHLNTAIAAQYRFGKKYINNVSLSGGKYVYQFNSANPIDEINNTLSTWLWQHNYIKLYEAWFVTANYSKDFGEGFTGSITARFQHRMPLNNTIDSAKGKAFTPNYPYEISNSNIPKHNAVLLSAALTWQPGTKYMELPDRKINLGSKYPTLRFSYTQGVENVLGSDVNYGKWRFTVSDNLNLKLAGKFSYRLETGGFVNTKKLFAPDYNHFLGNQTAIASSYLNSFQLLPYYQYSNTANFFGAGHIEYHLNGLLSNKIPVFKRLNWFFVVGGNGLYIDKNKYYYEGFFSVENIFKMARIDFVAGFQQDKTTVTGIRFSLPILFKSGGNGVVW